MLIFCPKVRGIWKESGFWRLLKRGNMATFQEVAGFLLKELEEEDFAMWCLLVWRIWKWECDIQHGSKPWELIPSLAESRGMWEACHKAKGLAMREMTLGVQCGERRWRKPDGGVIRVDVDAMFNEAANRFGVGVILRDWEGKVCGALSKKMSRKPNAMIAEVMAVVEGIVFCMKCGVEMIMVYTDSLFVARLMANEEEYEELLPGDICDILMKVREHLLIDVCHMFRTANRAAHLLAQRSSDFDHEMTWLDSYPSWLETIVVDDNVDE